MSALRVIVCGAGGRMGQEVCRIVESDQSCVLVAGVDRRGGAGLLPSVFDYSGEADVLIDFSSHDAISEVLEYCEEKNVPVVLATTGHSETEKLRIEAAYERLPVFHSANMSIGVALLARLVKQAAAIFRGCDVEIIEKHHNRKIDAPSGTALLLADAIKSERPDANYVYGRGGIAKRETNEIGIHALRMGNVVGEHEVMFATDFETITLRHEAHDRALFAEGAVAAAKFLLDKEPGHYHMEHLLGEG